MTKEIIIWGIIDISTGQYVKFGTRKDVNQFAIQEVHDTEDTQDHERFLNDFAIFGLVVDYLESKGYRLECVCTVN